MGGAFEYASAERGRAIERGREGWGCSFKRTWTFCLSTSFLPLSFPLSLPPSALHSSHKGRRGRRKGERRQSMKTFFLCNHMLLCSTEHKLQLLRSYLPPSVFTFLSFFYQCCCCCCSLCSSCHLWQRSCSLYATEEGGGREKVRLHWRSIAFKISGLLAERGRERERDPCLLHFFRRTQMTGKTTTLTPWLQLFSDATAFRYRHCSIHSCVELHLSGN